MPIHDWTRVDAGLFHAFHQFWIVTLSRALNAGVLPADYFALPEQSIQGPVPDVLTLKRTRVVRHAEEQIYVRKADRIAVRHRHGHIVAVVEIVSPSNKASANALRTFVEKTSKLIAQGIHWLVIDLFPPSKRDPQGIHKAIWDEFVEEDFELPAKERFDACRLRRRTAAGGLRRADRGRTGTARHADFPQARFLRSGAARRNLSYNLG